MRWQMLVGAVGFTLAMNGSIRAEEPGVVSPEQVEAAKTAERNTYRNKEYGFSITKPEEWAFVDSDVRNVFHARLRSDEENVRSLGIIAGIIRFPANADWVLWNPSALVEVLEFIKPVTDSELISGILLGLQSDSKHPATGVLPPQTVTLYGKSWKKAGIQGKFEGKKEGLYAEYHVHGLQNRAIKVEFSARTVDVPQHRKDVESVIQSIRIESPGATANPAGKVEL
ncbi:MAG: hypothetical protein HYZ92_01535 [Candidatus Omnitrophica bacterium]|nr:hypothetical protein [Candidatus Omnitrophota bacterium]